MVAATRTAQEWVTHWQSRRSHTAAELRFKLERKDFALAEIEAALAWAARYAGQNDDDVAEHTASSRKQQRYGQVRIAAELEARGVAENTTQRVTQSTASEEQRRADSALATEVARFKGNAHKAAAWLARRGFEEDIVRRAVERCIGPID